MGAIRSLTRVGIHNFLSKGADFNLILIEDDEGLTIQDDGNGNLVVVEDDSEEDECDDDD